jgi:hypothetical protein
MRLTRLDFWQNEFREQESRYIDFSTSDMRMQVNTARHEDFATDIIVGIYFCSRFDALSNQAVHEIEASNLRVAYAIDTHAVC